MKNLFNLSMFAVLSLALLSCGQQKSSENDHANHDSMPEMKEMKSEEVKEETETVAAILISKEQAQQILASYLLIKDALVQTDGEAASTSAGTLLSYLGGDDKLIQKLKNDAEHIRDTKDPGHQRDHFNTLSINVYNMLKSNSTNESPVYKQYCPMAFNSTGAFWLSAEKAILNPYFGDKMLTCGAVKETL